MGVERSRLCGWGGRRGRSRWIVCCRDCPSWCGGMRDADVEWEIRSTEGEVEGEGGGQSSWCG